jgi:hypothetical protein
VQGKKPGKEQGKFKDHLIKINKYITNTTASHY